MLTKLTVVAVVAVVVVINRRELTVYVRINLCATMRFGLALRL